MPNYEIRDPDSGIVATPQFNVGVYRSASKDTTGAGTVDIIDWDAEIEDNGGFHDNSTNNTRLTVPSGAAGLYVVTFGIFSSDAVANNSTWGHRDYQKKRVRALDAIRLQDSWNRLSDSNDASGAADCGRLPRIRFRPRWKWRNGRHCRR